MQQTQAGRVFLRLLVAVVVLGGAYCGLALFASRHVPTSTTVDRVAIGGMSPGEATVTLQRVLASRASRPVHLEAPSRTVDIDPGTAGLEIDVEATLADLSGFTLNPVNLWAHLTEGEDQPLRIRVDRARLMAAVAEAARAVDSPVQEGSITFTGGKVTAVVSAAGQVVNVPATTDAVAGAWPRQQVVKAVVNSAQPKLSADEINRAAREFAVPAMSGPVKVVAGRTTVSLQPVHFAPAVALVPDGIGRIRPAKPCTRGQ